MAEVSVIQVPEAFETERLRGRRPAMSDAEAVFEYGRDPEVTRYMEFRTHTEMRTVHEFLQGCAPRWASGEEFCWALTLKGDDRAIGTIACRIRGRALDFGYVLNRRYWGRGLATEAARFVVTWASELPVIDRIWAVCDAENLASARVLEKAGLDREGLLRRQTVRPNMGPEPRDTLVYARTRPGRATVDRFGEPCI
jgi:RimJ/RimL family protein N-acetyltransferase